MNVVNKRVSGAPNSFEETNKALQVVFKRLAEKKKASKPAANSPAPSTDQN